MYITYHYQKLLKILLNFYNVLLKLFGTSYNSKNPLWVTRFDDDLKCVEALRN